MVLFGDLNDFGSRFCPFMNLDGSAGNGEFFRKGFDQGLICFSLNRGLFDPDGVASVGVFFNTGFFTSRFYVNGDSGHTMRTLIFLSIFITVFALINAYVYRRFLIRLSFSESFRSFFLILIMILFASQIVYALTFRYDLFPASVYIWLGLSIGFSFILFVVALLYDLTGLIVHRIPFPANSPVRTIRIIFDSIMILVLMIYLVSGLVGGMKSPGIKTQRVEFPGLSPKRRVRIVHLTDIHVGRVIRKDFVARLVTRVNDLNPDLIVITGDLIDADPDQIQDDLAPLANLKANYGVYAVAGNHESIHNAEKSFKAIRNVGLNLLLDESTTIHILENSDPGGKGKPEQKGTTLQIVGLKDYSGIRMNEHRPDPDQAFAEVNDQLPVIVLAHQPVSIGLLEGRRVDLMLSGHTHGGQIFPFSLLVKLAQPYLAGLYRHDSDTQIYVSRGTGFWGPPIRVLAPSEIALIELVSPGPGSQLNKK